MNQDQEHLRLLSMFHYVVAAMAFLFASVFIVHVVIGAFVLGAPQKLAGAGEPPPGFIGWLFMGMGSAVVLTGWAYAGAMVVAGRSLARRRRYSFCLAMAAVSCALAPVGTVLGVFTLLVLLRPSVKPLFDS